MTPLPIEDLRVRVFEVPLAEPVRMSFSALPSRRTCVVEVHAGGLVGLGESWVNYPTWAWRERVATLCDGVAPLLLGTDATDVRAVHDRLVGALAPLGRQWGAPGPIWQAVSGVDMALWDLAGKAAGRPLAALLGGTTLPGGAAPPPAEVPVYASGIGPDRVEELTERAVALGVRALKVKIGFGRDRDEAVLKAARGVAGDGIEVFADANQAWTPGEAAEMCRLLVDHGVGWCEEPVAGNALEDLEDVHRRSGMPLATGENVYTLDSFTRYLASPAIAHIQPDVAKTGGITTAMRVASRGAAHGTAFSPHCYTGAPTIAATAHVAAATGAAWVEFDVRDNPLRTDLTVAPLDVRDGRLRVPDGPGLGITLDEARIAPYTIYA